MKIYIDHDSAKFNDAFGISEEQFERLNSVLIDAFIMWDEEKVIPVTHALEQVYKSCENVQELAFISCIFWQKYTKIKNCYTNPIHLFASFLDRLPSKE